MNSCYRRLKACADTAGPRSSVSGKGSRASRAFVFMARRLTVDRTPTVSFTIENVASTEVARQMAERGLFVSHGDFYAQTVIERLGLAPEGLVRVGCACYTSDEGG